MQSDSEETIINQCPECRQDLDVTELSPFSKIVCPYCSESVRVRTWLSQFEIKRMLGEGGMSQVFEAVDQTLDRRVALKILHQSLSRDIKLTQMFEREAKLTASINHPNVVKVYTVGRDQGYFYIAMELVDATSLEHMIADQGALPEEQVLAIAYDVVCGLRTAYQGNLIHRDIKPGNILVTPDGTAKLVDFGLAVAQGREEESEDLWATPYYVPPEKLQREPDTHLGDIYALGATCFHALAGKPPFDADTSSLEELIEIKSHTPQLKAAAPGTTRRTVKLVEQMMASKAKSRPGSYDQLLEKLEACQGEGSPAKMASHATGSKRKQLLIQGGIGLAALAALVFIVLQTQGNRNGDDLSDLLGNTGDRVISAEEREAAARVLAGRRAMLRGDFAEARDIFRQLGENSSFTQPSRAWNTYCLGLVELLLENEPEAREVFAGLLTQGGFDQREMQRERRFFEAAGKILSDALPVLRAELSLEDGSFEAVMLFAGGLKNWEMGHFGEAVALLQEFRETDLPENDAWIESLRPFTGKYLEDFRLLGATPKPSSRMTVKELARVESRLAVAERRLQTGGAALELLQRRAARTEEFRELASVREKPDPKGAGKAGPAWSDSEVKDAGTLVEIVAGFADLGTSLAFSEAIASLEQATVATPRGRKIRDTLVEGYRAADRFLPQLQERLDLVGYEGMVRRREGRPLDARITAAADGILTVDLGFGPNEVAIQLFDPGWLVEAGESTLGELSGATAASWQEVYWFARACGLTEEAGRLEKKLRGVDPEFARQQDRLEEVRAVLREVE